MTSAGIPDCNYCYAGVEGWLELKAGPDIEVRPTQLVWFRDRIKAGGWPLFLVQWGDIFMMVPGSAATSLKRNPSLENCLRNASTMWTGEINQRDFARVLRNPEKEYGKVTADLE